MSDEPRELEIVESETDETDGEDYSGRLDVTGYNQNIVATPVECGECDAEFFVSADTIKDEGDTVECSINYCPYCGMKIETVGTEF